MVGAAVAAVVAVYDAHGDNAMLLLLASRCGEHLYARTTDQPTTQRESHGGVRREYGGRLRDPDTTEDHDAVASSRMSAECYKKGIAGWA